MKKRKAIRFVEDPASGGWKIAINFPVPDEFVANILSRALGQPTPDSPTATEPQPTVVRVLSAGPNKIDAIKAIRVATQSGLKEAKDFIDSVPREYSCSDPAAAQLLYTSLKASGATAVLV